MVAIGTIISLAFVAFQIISLLTQRKKGPGASDFQGPRVEDGAVIPIGYGTFTVSPIVPWWGDVVPKEVKKGGLAGLGDQVVGYDYYVGVQAILCWGPIDKLIDIVFNDTKSVANAGLQGIPAIPQTLREPFTLEGDTGGALALPHTPLFPDAAQGFDLYVGSIHGGYEQGGVAGIVRFFWGGDAQFASGYLDAHQTLPVGATTISAWPQLCYAVFEAFWWGRNPTLPPVRFVVQRCPRVIPDGSGGLHGLHEIVGSDGLQNANPAHMIWELLTDTGPRGVGVAAALLDAPSFRAAADTLHAEDFGLSLVFDGSESAWDGVEEIIRHIGAALRTNRKTGLIELKLLRADYFGDNWDPPEVTPGDFDTINVSRPSHRQLVTEINLGYTDRARNFQRATERAWNQSLWDVTGERKRERVDFLGITDRPLAQVVAARECAQLSLPLAKMSGQVSRRISSLSVGDVFLLTSPEDGLYRTPMRLLGGEFGTIVDGRIQVDAIEDLFAAQGAIFDGTGTGGADPAPLNFRRPDVLVTQSSTATTGTVDLTLNDPDGRITLVEFDTKSGGNAATGWVTDASSPFQASVALDAVLQSWIAWRVTYTAADGTSAQLSGIVVFPAGQLLRVLSLVGAIDGQGFVTVTASVSPEITSVKMAGDVTGFPSDATVRAATADAAAPFVFTFGPIAPGETLYVKAFGYDASAAEGLAATTTISRAGTGQSFTVQAQFGNATSMAKTNDEWVVELPACTLTGTWRLFAPDGVSSSASIEVFKVATDGTETSLGTLAITGETASGTLAGAPIAFTANQRVLFRCLTIGAFLRLNASLDATR